MDPPTPKKLTLQRSSSKAKLMDADPPEGDVEPMEVDLPPEEEPMEVNSLPSGPGRHCNLSPLLSQALRNRERPGLGLGSSELLHGDYTKSPDSREQPATSRQALKKREGMGLASSELLHPDIKRSPADSPKLPAASSQCQRSYRGNCSFGEAEDFGLDRKKG